MAPRTRGAQMTAAMSISGTIGWFVIVSSAGGGGCFLALRLWRGDIAYRLRAGASEMEDLPNPAHIRHC